MSALPVDELFAQAPFAEAPSVQANGWRRVRGRESTPQLSLVPTPTAPAIRPGSSQWHLTDRGIRVVVSFFLALFATAALLVLTSFFAVSDAPIIVPQSPVAAVALG